MYTCIAWPWSSQEQLTDKCEEYTEAWETILGVPYKFGEEDPNKGLDCSGAIFHVFKKTGRPIPRTTSRKLFVLISDEPKHYEESVCGNLVWFTLSPSRPYGHVGMITNNPPSFWHAGSSTGVTTADIHPENYWEKHFKAVKNALLR